MFEDHNDGIILLLQEGGYQSEDELLDLQEQHLSSGKSIAELLIDNGIYDRPAMLQMVADYLHFEYQPDVPDMADEILAHVITPADARMYGVVPVHVDDYTVEVLAKDPFNHSIIDDLTFTLNKDVSLVVGDPEAIDRLLIATYGEEDSMEDVMGEFEDIDEEEDQGNATPIIRFVNLVLAQAVRDKASDIHFEPFENEFKIRYRIDGSLYEMAPPPQNLSKPVVSRIKVLADLNISEDRIPQDGRIKLTISGKPVDLRVSTLPTQFGESVVLRILDKSATTLDLEALNLPDDIKENIRSLVSRPNGIFIVTGPTGSGKTTTLYSALREVNKVDTKIITAEDPVEYEIDGLMQTAINHTVGLTFAAALRSFLRQDPDKIMVGEIRDLETAQISVQASLTGHVVLSTLHTNDAAGTVTRMIDMGLEPFLIAAALEGILGQRLVRRIDEASKVAYEPDQKLLDKLELDPLEAADKKFYYGKGTPENPMGYKGRQGLFEMMMISDAMRELISENTPTLVLKQRAIEEGMRSLRDDGIRAIFDGTTTIEEVLKYT